MGDVVHLEATYIVAESAGVIVLSACFTVRLSRAFRTSSHVSLACDVREDRVRAGERGKMGSIRRHLGLPEHFVENINSKVGCQGYEGPRTEHPRCEAEGGRGSCRTNGQAILST